MKINLGKWGTPVSAALTALATVLSDGVLDAPDIVTVLVALMGAAGTIFAGMHAYKSDPNQDQPSG